jgi:hypothetical protein
MSTDVSSSLIFDISRKFPMRKLAVGPSTPCLAILFLMISGRNQYVVKIFISSKTIAITYMKGIATTQNVDTPIL